jgi:hypothetical protein
VTPRLPGRPGSPDRPVPSRRRVRAVQAGLVAALVAVILAARRSADAQPPPPDGTGDDVVPPVARHRA